jgi:hypothetical protein
MPSYYVNEHPDGDSDRGSFEGRVTTAGSQTTIEGTFTAAIRLRGEPITNSPKIMAPIHDSIKLARMCPAA